MSELTSSEARLLGHLCDKEACRDLIAEYGPALDWLDEARLSSLFWPDAEIDFGFLKGAAGELVPPIMQYQRAGIRGFHLAAGERLQVSGDEALAERYLIGMGGMPSASGGEPLSHMWYGRYLFRLQKRNGQWRIRRLEFLTHGGHEWLPRLPSEVPTPSWCEPAPDHPWNVEFKAKAPVPGRTAS